MSRELALQREITPDVWGMLSEIIQSGTNSQLERALAIQKALFCYENELPISLAFSGGIYVVKGRIEAEGSVIRARINALPNYDYQIKDHSREGCTVEVSRLIDGEWQVLGEAAFTKDDAERAGLIKKDGAYEKYPREMYLNRATARAYKWFCPEIFFQSIYITGELSPDTYTGDDLLTLDVLLETYTHEQVLEAMEGVIPSTPEEVQEAWDRLEGIVEGEAI